MVDKSYSCDLCRDRIVPWVEGNPGKPAVGIQFGGGKAPNIRKVHFMGSERHLCLDCIHSVLHMATTEFTGVAWK